MLFRKTLQIDRWLPNSISKNKRNENKIVSNRIEKLLKNCGALEKQTEEACSAKLERSAPMYWGQ